MACAYCNFEMCFQCSEPREDELNATGDYRCCCDGLGYQPQRMTLADTFMANRTDVEEDDIVGPRLKDGSLMKDVISTGRKRAAKAAPITEGMVCEWAGLAKAGGGVKPIVGCGGWPASDRHHGPDKNVLNNEVGVNLHRICDHCHARWHSANDEFYGERPPAGQPFIPITGAGFMHDPHTKASPEEIARSEQQWQLRKAQREALTNVEQSDTVFVEADGEADNGQQQAI